MTQLSDWLPTYPRLAEALQTCFLRFVVNLPEESLRSAPRLCFELQAAFWFYLDYLHEGAKRELPKLKQHNFVYLMLESSDVLRSIYDSPKSRNQLFQEWRAYLRNVPLKGAVLLNKDLDKCLMVQPWKGNTWTYPRGKINEDESEGECAVREVWEETGIDITGRLNVEQFVRAYVDGKECEVKLFVVPDIPEEVPMAPNTRKEISKIGWITLASLPGWDPGNEEAGLRFFCVEPFVHGIQTWVEDLRVARNLLPQTGPGSRRSMSQAPRGGVDDSRASRRSMSQVGTSRRTASARAPDPVRCRGRRAWVNGSSTTRESGDGNAREKSMGAQDPSSPFHFDLVKVMKAFDRGWDSAAKVDTINHLSNDAT